MYVHKELNVYKQLLMTKYVLEEVMARLYYSMLTKTFVKHYWKHNYLEALMAYVQAEMEYNFWLQQIKDLFIVCVQVISLKCYSVKIIQNQS